MSRIDELLARQKEIEDEIAAAKLDQRDEVLADIKNKIKLFGFKKIEFRSCWPTRKRSNKQ